MIKLLIALALAAVGAMGSGQARTDPARPITGTKSAGRQRQQYAGSET